MYGMDIHRELFRKDGVMARGMAILLWLVFLGWGMFSLGQGSALATLVKADKVVVIKSKRMLMLMKDGELFRAYKVALGKNPEGRKTKVGDRRTPEGSYVIDSRNSKSKFYRAIHISYPNEADISSAQKLGVSPGGSIMIHGLPNGFARVDKFHRVQDWTDGCIAVTNSEIEEIWEYVADGTPIEIKP
jgi:murein L,D-transpeptidase YafK